jgi:hypothetical protein
VGSLVDYRRVAVCAVYSSFGLAVLAQARHRQGVEALGWLVCASAILYWCTLDAHIRGKTFHHGWAVAFMFTWPVALPIYLVWTQGWRGLGTYAAAIGLFVATAISAALLGVALR